MPIKPENKSRYPKNWPEIRRAILDRAEGKCEHSGCAAQNYSVGIWIRSGNGDWMWAPIAEGQENKNYSDAKFFAANWHFDRGEDSIKPTIIVLTIAHLDHTPENCEMDNLKAMCQRHHLAHDLNHHKQTSYLTRKKKASTLDLF